MKHNRMVVMGLLVAGVLVMAAAVWHASRESVRPSLAPPRAHGGPGLLPCHPPGRRWRVAVYEGGSWPNYSYYLDAFLAGLEEMGWLPHLERPAVDDRSDTLPTWQFLAAADTGDYLEFPADAWYSAQWQEGRREEVRTALERRLAEQGDIDIVLALGTWAGQDLATDAHRVPVLIMSVSDPVAAGIVPSATDSGHDHVHCRTDPERWRRQIRLFHRLVGFKTLGTVGGTREESSTYVNLPDLRAMAAECGFRVVVRQAPETDNTPEEAAHAVRAQLELLAPEVDAVWLSSHRGTVPRFMPWILEPLLDRGVPTWSTLGPAAVEHGALFGLASEHFGHAGRFEAETMARILNGAKPGDLPQVYAEPKRLAVNLKTAERIGFDVPHSLVAAADCVYRDIAGIGEGPPHAP